MATHGSPPTTVNPPGVIRGLNSQNQNSQSGSLGLHWLRGSIPGDDREALVSYLKLWFGDEVTRRQYGLWFYDASVLWPNGVTLNYHSSPSRDALTRGRIGLEVPGGALEAYPTDMVMSFIRGLQDFGFQCSRLDVFYDDISRRITPAELFKTVFFCDDQGVVLKHDFTGFRKINRREISDGKTRTYDEVAFGVRGDNGSGKYLRVYDKAIESKGQNKAVRWELELSRERAHKAYEMLLNATTEAAVGLLGAMVGGCIDFKLRTGDKNLDRLNRYVFWQDIVNDLGRASLAGKVPDKSVEKAQEHIAKQAAGNMQLLRNAWGAEKFFPWLADLVGDNSRMRQNHYDALKRYERQIEGDDTLHIDRIRSYCDEHGIELEATEPD